MTAPKSTFQLQLLVFSSPDVETQEIFRAAAAVGVAAVHTADAAVAAESIRTYKFDGIVVDSGLEGATSIGTAIASSRSNQYAPVMCILPIVGTPAFVAQYRPAVVLSKPVSRLAMFSSLKLLWTKMVGERRRYFRCPADLPVSIRSSKGEERLVRAKDISRGGIAVSGAFEPSDVVSLRFTIPGQTQEAIVSGQVVWGNGQTSAVRFVSFRTRDKAALDQWLSSKCDEALGIDGVGAKRKHAIHCVAQSSRRISPLRNV